MSYQKILVSVSGAYKEIDASIDGSLLSSSLTISTTTASIPLNNGLLAVSGGLLTTVTGSTANQIIEYTNNGAEIKSITDTISAGAGDLNYSSGKIQVTNISNVTGGILPSLYGGTGTGSFSSGSIVTAAGNLHITTDLTYPAAMCNFTAPKTTLTDNSLNANTIAYPNPSTAITAPPVPLFSGNAMLSAYDSTDVDTYLRPTFRVQLPQANISDLTMETWVYPTNVGQSPNTTTARSAILSGYIGSTSTLETQFLYPTVFINSSSQLTFLNGTSIPSTELTINLNAWNHVALVRKNNKYKVYLNGTGSIWFDSNGLNNINRIYVGSNGDGRYNVNGYFSDFNYVTYAKSEKQIKEYYNKKAAGTLTRRTATDSSTEKIITVNTGGTLAYRDKSYSEITLPTYPLAYLYTGALGNDSSNSYTWTKPVGCRMVRVICQGGGGAGGSATVTGTQVGGAGGAGGGYSETFLSADGLPSTVLLKAGSGGIAVSSAASITTDGGSGGPSQFGNYILATGGGGGRSGYRYTQAPRQSTGGTGNRYSGGGGGYYAATGGTPLGGVSVVLGGAGGGAGGRDATNGTATVGGNITSINITAGSAGAGGASSTNASPPGNGTLFPVITQAYVNNSTAMSALPNLVWAGGSGGGSGSSNVGRTGSTPTYGSGGGGGGEGNNGIGGNGGVGYVLIICY